MCILKEDLTKHDNGDALHIFHPTPFRISIIPKVDTLNVIAASFQLKRGLGPAIIQALLPGENLLGPLNRVATELVPHGSQHFRAVRLLLP